MTIYGLSGRLGKGKTFTAVIDSYTAYLRGDEVFSNIWLDFPHTPIKTPYDLLELHEGFFLGDELWVMCDSRKSYTRLNDAVMIIALRSRKKRFDIEYTQQYILQVDRRLRFYTDYWIKPEVFPNAESGLAPEILVQHIIDGDGKTRPDSVLENLRDYYSLFNTEKDPYTISSMINDETIKKAISKTLDNEPDIKEDMNKPIKDKPIPEMFLKVVNQNKNRE